MNTRQIRKAKVRRMAGTLCEDPCRRQGLPGH
jgi:hypothetical protein